jgi:hypothetical protein
MLPVARHDGQRPAPPNASSGRTLGRATGNLGHCFALKRRYLSDDDITASTAVWSWRPKSGLKSTAAA